MAGTAQPLTNQATQLIADMTATKLVAALERKTAALLTIAAQMLAFSLANRGQTLTEDEIRDEVLEIFNRFLRS